ncbi:WD40 repeat domain-containing protein [bacterium]|nr:WD40 repeat domain-containing protein [bacterium]
MPFNFLQSEVLPLETVIQTGHSGAVLSVDFSPDGQYLISCGTDNSIKLWIVETGRELRTFIGHSQDVQCVRFSSDGKYIISGSKDRTAKLWDVLTGETIRTYEKHSDEINAVAFSNDDGFIGTASNDKTAILWDTETGKIVHFFEGHKQPVSSIAFSPDNRYLLTGSFDYTAKLWSLENGKNVRTYKGTFSSFAGGLFKGIFRNMLDGHSDYVTSVDFSPNGEFVATGSHDQTVRLWRTTTGEEIRDFKARSKSGSLKGVTSICFNRDNDHIVTGNLDGTVRIWKTSKRREVQRFEGHTDFVNSVVYSPDGRYIASCGGSAIRMNDKTIRIWNVEEGKEIRVLSVEARSGISVCFCPDNDRIITSYGDGSSRRWNLRNGGKTESNENGSPVIRSDFEPLNKCVVTQSLGDTTRIWDAANNEVIDIFNEESHRVITAGRSSDGRFLVTGSLDHTAKLWNCETGEDIRTFYGHLGGVFSADFSPDDRFIVTGSLDNTARLWEVRTGREILKMGGHQYSVASVDYSQDGNQIVTGSIDGLTTLWDVKSNSNIAKLIPIDRKDWIVVTPDGFFDKSDGIKQSVYFVQGMQIWELQQFHRDFYHPNLLELIISSQSGLLPDMSVSEMIEKSPPPSVEIISPKVGERLLRKTIEVEVEAKNEGGGIREFKFLHNGKRIAFNSVSSKKKTESGDSSMIATFTVPLVSGNNELATTAFSDAKIESLPAKLDILLKEGGREEIIMYVIAVGIDEYTDNRFNLQGAINGAIDFANTFKTLNNDIYNKVEVITLTDFEATRENVLTVLDEIGQVAEPEELIVFYFAGRSIVLDGEYYLLTVNNYNFHNRELLNSDAIKVGEFQNRLMNIWALEQLIVIDAPLVDDARLAFNLRSAIAEKALSDLATGSGVNLFASSGINYTKEEIKLYGKGLFTQVFIEGLQGKAETDSSDGNICISELKDYISNELPLQSKEVRKQVYYPDVITTGVDFPLIRK